MAYAIKYLFKFESSNGTTREIRVLQDGYTGEVIQRPLGRAPVLKKQQNGPVHGTSLEFYAECNVDREFIEFYTSDPKAYRVDLYAGAALLWQGYITPELYSEPDIAPPYDVQVVATDGVGELKLYEYAAQGTVTLRTLLSGLLSRTGLGTDIYLISSLKPGSAGAGSLLEKTINLDYMAGNSCYEVLTYILDTLHATITWWKGTWILSRETNVTFTNGKVRYFNTAGNSALLADSVQTLGSLRANPAWPVGQLSTVIDPAKNRVTVQAPWHVVTCLRNSEMGSDADWVKAKNARYETDGYVLPININTGTSETAVISQATSMAGLRVPMSLSVKATGATSEISAQAYGAVIGVLLTYKVGSVTYHLVKGTDGTPTWQQGDDIGTYIPLRTRVDFQQQLATWDSSRIEAEELTIDNIPPFLQGTAFPAGTLTVYILGYCAKIYGAYLDVVLPKGYQDILRIDNGARGEGSEVEIAIGRETADNAYYAAFLQGLLLDSGNLITSFSDANFPGGMDYLAFIARDYALSVALPRAKVTGTVYLESGIAAPPLVFTKGALNYWLQTWSWNLYEDELEIEGLTLPSASLTVESETILESNGSTVSSAGGAGSSSAGSPMGGGVGTNYWEIDGTLNTLLKPKDAYAYVHSKDGLFFTGAALSGTVVPDLYVDTVNNQRVLRSPLPLITGGDQIVIDGTPGGGGGGGGATTLAGLDDTNITNPQAGQMLSWNGTKWVNVAAPSFILSPATTTVLGGIKVGSGLSVTSDGTLSTTNAGTVTSVKVGTTTYNPTDGVVSLPEYPSYSRGTAITISSSTISVAGTVDSEEISFDPDTHSGADASNPVAWGSASGTYGIKLSVNNVTKDLVLVSGYNALASRVTALENAPEGGITKIGTYQGAVTLGANLSITENGVLSAVDTTYGVATTSAAGLMSADDKSKLNGIASGATNVTDSTVSGWGYVKSSGIISVTKGSAVSGGAVTTEGGAVTIQFPTAITYDYASSDTAGLIKIGTGLTISDEGVVSVTGQTMGTVTRVDVGTSQYSPSSAGVVSLPAYPTTLPASDVSAWAKASSKPSYTFSELTAHPTTISGYGITDAKIANGVITLGSNTITPLTAHQSLDGYVNALTRTPTSGGNYVSSVTKSGKTITVTYATLPTSLPASDVYSWAKAENKPSYAFSEITGTAAAAQIPTLAISKVSGLQTALDGKQPLDSDLTAIAAISTGTGLLKRSVSGSTVTWSIDTTTYLSSHQTIYQLVINNSAGTAQITYKPATSGTYSLTLTKAMVGLSNVPNWVYTIKDSSTQTFTA